MKSQNKWRFKKENRKEISDLFTTDPCGKPPCMGFTHDLFPRSNKALNIKIWHEINYFPSFILDDAEYHGDSKKNVVF